MQITIKEHCYDGSNDLSLIFMNDTHMTLMLNSHNRLLILYSWHDVCLWFVVSCVTAIVHVCKLHLINWGEEVGRT